MEIQSSINLNETRDLLANSKTQESASSIDSIDTESCQIEAKIAQLEIDKLEAAPLKCDIISIKKNSSNKFIDLISQEENNTEKVETCQTDEYDQHSGNASPKSMTEEVTCELERNELEQDDKQLADLKDIIKDEIYESSSQKASSNALIKRTHLKSLIYEMYEESVPDKKVSNLNKQVEILIEGIMEKLPPGKSLKNSVLLAWKQRYFQLNSIGLLKIYETVAQESKTQQPIEVYNLMGARVTYEQNRVISLDDGRGNSLVFRCFNDTTNQLFQTWKSAIDSQIIDRSETLWVRPNEPLSLNTPVNAMLNAKSNKKILIIDIGTCSIRAGLFNDEPKLPTIFQPTVCARDSNELGEFKLRIGFDAFDSVLASTAPSTIDLNKAGSMWSLNSTTSISGAGNHLIHPLKNKKAIDKLNMDIGTIDAIIEFVVDSLNVQCNNHQIVVITPQKFSDKINVQFLNLLLVNEKYQFESATLMNQTLMALYSYNSTVGVVVNLGEKIDIVPICNGISFQSGVSNLAYGGSRMSEYLNSYISRGHQNYVSDMEQYYVRYIKEKACYAALDYKDECAKYPSENIKYKLELNDQVNDFKKVEFPELARFNSVEGLFNPEIWGIDGQGVHKLIHKAIQSSSMDLRREMARNIYICGGMSRIPGVQKRLENELKKLLPSTITVKVNCSDFSMHSAYLGAHKFISQPEYKSLVITREEWSNENVNCLKKWRML